MTIALNIYDEIKINENMCSYNCPCKPVTSKASWESVPPNLLKADRNLSLKPWDFSGTDLVTYKQCITDPTKRGVFADLEF